jgi:hypothetical protein
MRVEKQAVKPAFEPVAIILETQEEVDKLYAVLNYAPITDAVRMDNWRVELFPHRSEASHELWLRLRDALRNDK